MDIALKILRISERETDQVDYENLIFIIETKSTGDINSSSELWAVLNTFVNGGVRMVLIDMNDLEYIDSSTIGVCIKAAKLLRKNKGDIAFVHVPPTIKQIFKPVNLDRFIKFFESVDEAKHFFRLK